MYIQDYCKAEKPLFNWKTPTIIRIAARTRTLPDFVCIRTRTRELESSPRSGDTSRTGRQPASQKQPTNYIKQLRFLIKPYMVGLAMMGPKECSRFLKQPTS